MSEYHHHNDLNILERIMQMESRLIKAIASVRDISSSDQALLDGLLVRFKRVTEKLERLDAKTPNKFRPQKALKSAQKAGKIKPKRKK